MFCRSAKEVALYVMNQRKKLGFSQTEVANRVGLKQKTISAFENNPEGTKLATLFQILSAVNLDMNILTKGEKGSELKWEHEW